LIWEPGTERLVGFGRIGPHADEAAASAVMAIEMGATLADLAEMIAPAGTGADILSAAARDAMDPSSA
jgi:pyruvate/2-oxoglutarate dehydrogenase complex dihydrolipoamide dehydrogenase (E3) component